MKKKFADNNISLLRLKPIKGSITFNISSKRHNTSMTPSINFYKPISKFKITEEKI